jgi:hypothetical protein
MPLTTKGGLLLVKDGKLQTNCNCCGEWYCNPDTIPLVGTVSGWSNTADCAAGQVGPAFSNTYAFRNYIPGFNGSYNAIESCGEASIFAETIESGSARGEPLGGSMLVETWLSNLSLSNTISCQSGFVSRKVKVSLRYDIVNDFRSRVRLLYSGGIESACFDLNSLPQTGSWISGQSFSVPVIGKTYRVTSGGGIFLLDCTFPTLDISVSFQ